MYHIILFSLSKSNTQTSKMDGQPSDCILSVPVPAGLEVNDQQFQNQTSIF